MPLLLLLLLLLLLYIMCKKACITLSCQFVVAIIYEVSGLSDSEHTCGCVSLEDTDGSVSSLVVGSTSSLSGICRGSP